MNQIPGYGVDSQVFYQQEKKPLNNMLMINKDLNIFVIKCYKEPLNCLLQYEIFKKHIKIKMPFDQLDSLYSRLNLGSHFNVDNIAQWLDTKGNILGSILAMNQVLSSLNVIISPVDDLAYSSLVQKAAGYLFWQDGWVVLRRANGCWYYMDPRNALPNVITETYLHCIVSQIIMDGGLIFAVTGQGMHSYTCGVVEDGMILPLPFPRTIKPSSPFQLVPNSEPNSTYFYLELMASPVESISTSTGSSVARYSFIHPDLTGSNCRSLPEPEPPDQAHIHNHPQSSSNCDGEPGRSNDFLNGQLTLRPSRSTDMPRRIVPWKQTVASNAPVCVTSDETILQQDNEEWPSLSTSSKKRYRSKSRKRSSSVGRDESGACLLHSYPRVASRDSQQHLTPRVAAGNNQQCLTPRITAGNNQQYLTPRVAAGNSQQFLTPRVTAGNNQQYLTPRVAAGNNQQYLTPRVTAGNNQQCLTPRVTAGNNQQYLTPRDAAWNNQQYLTSRVTAGNNQQYLIPTVAAGNNQQHHTSKDSYEEKLKIFEERNSQRPKGKPGDTLNARCCICLEAPSCVVLQPCRHLCLCTDCKPLYLKDYKHCPICQQVIKSHTDVFLA